jgi:hypothetical protein
MLLLTTTLILVLTIPHPVPVLLLHTAYWYLYRYKYSTLRLRLPLPGTGTVPLPVPLPNLTPHARRLLSCVSLTRVSNFERSADGEHVLLPHNIGTSTGIVPRTYLVPVRTWYRYLHRRIPTSTPLQLQTCKPATKTYSSLHCPPLLVPVLVRTQQPTKNITHTTLLTTGTSYSLLLLEKGTY